MTQEAQSGALSAPYTIAFPFERTAGPVIGAFLAGLREGTLLGVKGAGGSVLCPVLEFDPRTGDPAGELVPLSGHGTVRAWTWVRARAGDVLSHDFAWALIALDGAEGALFHAVDTGGDSSRMAAGLRVQLRWRQDRVGDIRDIECFEPEPEERSDGGTRRRAGPRRLTASTETVSSSKSPLHMDYTYVAGAGRSLFLRGLAQRRLLARRCPACAQVYLPPPEFCSRCLTGLGEPFELAGTGVVATFCVVNFQFPGQVYEPPYVVAYLQLDGAGTRLMHLLREVEPGGVHIGMRVEPVWRPAGELEASMNSIRYFRPVPRPADGEAVGQGA